MIFSTHQFRFSLLGSILTVVGISVFFSLGTWQVDRAGEKQSLQDKIDSRQNLAEVVLQSSVANIEQKLYAPVKAIGRYDPEHEILIDNEVHQGTAGYHVLTPLVLKQDHSVVMVNRGWVPVGRSRQVLPDISTPYADVTIFGVISPPKSKPALILGQANLGSSKVWAYFDPELYARKTGYSLLPMVILMDESKGEGYVRHWPKYDAKVSMHIGYAIQWYFFALIVFITYIAVNLKKKNVNDTEVDVASIDDPLRGE